MCEGILSRLQRWKLISSIFPCSVSLASLQLFCDLFAFFSTRQWDDQMLSDACRLVLDEIDIPPTAGGGMVEYRRTLIISLLFKFYLKVRRGLNKMVNDFSGLWALTFWAVCTVKDSPFPSLLHQGYQMMRTEGMEPTECSLPASFALLLSPLSFSPGLRRGQSCCYICPIGCVTILIYNIELIFSSEKLSVSKL